jgi:hypothetical protein
MPLPFINIPPLGGYKVYIFIYHYIVVSVSGVCRKTSCERHLRGKQMEQSIEGSYSGCGGYTPAEEADYIARIPIKYSPKWEKTIESLLA